MLVWNVDVTSGDAVIRVGNDVEIRILKVGATKARIGVSGPREREVRVEPARPSPPVDQ